MPKFIGYDIVRHKNAVGYGFLLHRSFLARVLLVERKKPILAEDHNR